MNLLDHVRQWLERHADTLRSLPIVKDLWRVIEGGLEERVARSETLDYFLAGDSIQRAAARLWPGHHGPEMVAEQLKLQDTLRGYVRQLEDDLHEFQRQAAAAAQNAQGRAERLDNQIAKLQRENQLLRQHLAASQKATTPGAPAPAPR